MANLCGCAIIEKKNLQEFEREKVAHDSMDCVWLFISLVSVVNYSN